MEPTFEEYVADDGDLCDSCGSRMADGDPLFSDPRVRVLWRFCSMDCAHRGVTDKSLKARFINAVLKKDL